MVVDLRRRSARGNRRSRRARPRGRARTGRGPRRSPWSALWSDRGGVVHSAGRRLPAGSVGLVLGRHDEHRAVGVVDKPMRDAAQDRRAKAAPSARADHDGRGVDGVGVLEDRLPRRSLRLDGDRMRTGDEFRTLVRELPTVGSASRSRCSTRSGWMPPSATDLVASSQADRQTVITRAGCPARRFDELSRARLAPSEPS